MNRFIMPLLVFGFVAFSIGTRAAAPSKQAAPVASHVYCVDVGLVNFGGNLAEVIAEGARSKIQKIDPLAIFSK